MFPEPRNILPIGVNGSQFVQPAEPSHRNGRT
jgi:hypothetical protein